MDTYTLFIDRSYLIDNPALSTLSPFPCPLPVSRASPARLIDQTTPTRRPPTAFLQRGWGRSRVVHRQTRPSSRLRLSRQNGEVLRRVQQAIVCLDE